MIAGIIVIAVVVILLPVLAGTTLVKGITVRA